MAIHEGRQKCLYEILGVDATAPAEEIRVGYRMLALKFHPNKTVDKGVSQEETTQKFQEILGAHEALSDPQDRSRYDAHRCKILLACASSSYAKKSDSSPSSTEKSFSSKEKNISDTDLPQFTWVDVSTIWSMENQKKRDEVKRKHNETVGVLSEFVRMRDKRVEKAVKAEEKVARAGQYEQNVSTRVDEGQGVDEDDDVGSDEQIL